MKQFLKVFIPILLIVALLIAASWFLLIDRRDLTASVFRYWGDFFRDRGRYNRSIFFYQTAWKLLPGEVKFPLRLADSYVKSGNYTKAEYTLVSAIMQIPDSVQLYTALSKVYVDQDKLLDAESMLGRITNEAVKSEIEKLRPQTPVITPESGYYSDYISVSIEADGGTVYAVRNVDFPSSERDLYTEPIQLEAGETKIVALTVAPNGLVSDAAYAGYTVGNVVEEVWIQDRAVNALARQLLEKTAADPIMSDELWTIESLDLPDDVASLEDLPLFSSLRSLSLHRAQGLDLSILSQLPTLQSLDLSGCTLSSSAVETIVTLPELTELDLSGCAIADIGALVGLQKLEYLDLSNNTISDLTALSALGTLRELYLTNNPIGSISNLSNCTALEVLHADSCQLAKLNGLVDHAQLRELNVSDNRITDISVLSSCPLIENIDISYNQIEDISVLGGMKQLRIVNASNNVIREIPVFDKKTPLWRFDVSSNQIEDLSGLDGNETLNFIRADYNAVSTIEHLYSCNLLVQIDVWDNPISREEANHLQEVGIIVNFNPEYQPPEPEPEPEEEADNT